MNTVPGLPLWIVIIVIYLFIAQYSIKLYLLHQ